MKYSKSGNLKTQKQLELKRQTVDFAHYRNIKIVGLFALCFLIAACVIFIVSCLWIYIPNLTPAKIEAMLDAVLSRLGNFVVDGVIALVFAQLYEKRKPH